MQFVTYVSNMAHFNLGYSYRNDADVSSLISNARANQPADVDGVRHAVALGIILVLLPRPGAIPARQHHFTDQPRRLCDAGFWLGLMMIVIFRSASAGCRQRIRHGRRRSRGWAEVWSRSPSRDAAVSLALFYLALYARLMRASVLEQTGMDYVTTARAKGQTERRIMTGHVLRNALLPIVTMRRSGRQSDRRSIVVETVFGWPGIGTLAFNALQSRDLNLLLAIFFMSACLDRDHQLARRRDLRHARPAHGD